MLCTLFQVYSIYEVHSIHEVHNMVYAVCTVYSIYEVYLKKKFILTIPTYYIYAGFVLYSNVGNTGTF